MSSGRSLGRSRRLLIELVVTAADSKKAALQAIKIHLQEIRFHRLMTYRGMNSRKRTMMGRLTRAPTKQSRLKSMPGQGIKASMLLTILQMLDLHSPLPTRNYQMKSMVNMVVRPRPFNTPLPSTKAQCPRTSWILNCSRYLWARRSRPMSPRIAGRRSIGRRCIIIRWRIGRRASPLWSKSP